MKRREPTAADREEAELLRRYGREADHCLDLVLTRRELAATRRRMWVARALVIVLAFALGWVLGG